MIKKITRFALVFSILLLSAIFYVEHSFSSIRVTPFYDGCKKIWGHQGHNDSQEQSSLDRFEHAFDLGAAGIEFNLLWDKDLESFVIRPKYSYTSENMGLLTLEEVFKKIGSRGYFWLDLKNLGKLDKSESASAAENMSALLDRFGLKSKVIIESKKAAKLAAFGDRGMFTCLWITPGKASSRFEAWLKMFPYKVMFLKDRFSAFSMDYVYYYPHIRDILGHIPVHLFTLNDESGIMNYLHMPNVKIILSDRTDKFSLDSCDERRF